MNRERSYYRIQRARHINRRRRICHYYTTNPIIYTNPNRKWGVSDFSVTIPFEWYTIKGRYNKGHIHCSCAKCSCKTRNKGHRRQLSGNYAPSLNYKIRDLRRIEEMKYEVEEIKCLKKF